MVVSREYPFEQAQQAYADILDGHTKGKSVLIFND
ncbi:MAG: zinc-binding dehydrogenase [Acinetobacter sp.]|nr:zinc-binding dehydrogenase [Acinetobacter sp.]